MDRATIAGLTAAFLPVGIAVLYFSSVWIRKGGESLIRRLLAVVNGRRDGSGTR